MKLKTLSLILVFLSVVAIIATLTTQHETEQPELAHERVVPISVIESLTRIELKEKDEGSLVLTKSDQNHWFIDNEDSLPADFDKLKRLTKDLMDLKYERLVTENPERIKTLELDKAEIVLGNSSNDAAFTLSKGKSGNSGGFYAQAQGQSEAWLVDGSLFFDADAEDWIDKTPFSMQVDDIATLKLSLKDSEEIFSTMRSDSDAEFTSENLSENEALRQSEIKSLARNLTTLRFAEAKAIDEDAIKEALSFAKEFSFTDFNKNQVTISIGRKPEETIEKAAEEPDSAAEGDDNTETEVADSNSEPNVKTETIPAGPVYMQLVFSDSSHPWDAASQRFAFKVDTYQYEQLFKIRSDLVEAIEEKENKVEEVTQIDSSEPHSDSSKG